MQTSVAGLAEMAGHEGIVPYRYFDSVAVDTFGIGHTHLSGNAPDPRRMAFGVEHELGEVVEIFARDVASVERRVTRAMTRPPTQTQFDAGCSFDLNTGGILRATWVKSHNAGDHAKAAAEIMNWLKPPEIEDRRAMERALYRSGKYGQGGRATVYPADGRGRVLWSKGKTIDVLPFAKEIRGAADAHGEADGARDRSVQTGGAAGGSGAATQIPADGPGVNILGFDLTLLQLGLIAVGLLLAGLAILFFVRSMRARRSATNQAKSATEVLKNAISKGD